jgi:glycosyltransferase involved in cell wall biosynthesis
MAYVPFLRDAGHHVTLLSPLRMRMRRGALGRVGRLLELLRDLREAPHHDVVLVYRKTFPGGFGTALGRRCRRLVFEFDDAIYLPSPSEPKDRRTCARYRRNFDTTVAHADLIIAGNATLAGGLARLPVAVVPTGVDLEVFRLQPQEPTPESCVIGWIGTAENFPEWQRLVPVFRRLVATDPGIRFRLVTDRAVPLPDLPVELEMFSIEREAECLHGVDIGLMPLEDTAWNRGKCSVKALQCMAIGAPVVVSPVGMNREVVEDGVTGRLATTDASWEEALRDLVRSPDRRRDMGRAARRTVEAHYSLATVGGRVVGLLENLLAQPGYRTRDVT